MQIAFFSNGGFVAHRYRIEGLKSKFSVWYNRDGFAIDAERIDSLGRSYPVKAGSKAWEYISRHKIAGLDGESQIAVARTQSV